MQLEQPLASYSGKPELDDGHTKIANELLDAIICHDFSKRQLKILFYIIRKTYGWNKAEDDISRSQMVKETGLSNPNITTTIQELQAANVLIVTNGTHAKKYKINKYYDQWRVINLITIIKTIPVIETITIIETITDRYQNDNISLSKQDPQKTTPKDNTKYISDFDIFWKAYPKKTGKVKCLSLWKKIKPDVNEILKTLSWQKSSEQWKKEGGQFIPNPLTYLNQGRWMDEPFETESSEMVKLRMDLL